MLSVQLCILEYNDENKFRTQRGISVKEFLELFSVYLRSTFIGCQDNVFVQCSGVCIVLRVAPVLSNIFFRKDRQGFRIEIKI